MDSELETDLSEASSEARKLCVRRRMSSRVAGREESAEFALLDLDMVFAMSILNYPSYPDSFTDFPAYSDTGYIDTPVTVTVLTVPNWSFIQQE